MAVRRRRVAAVVLGALALVLVAVATLTPGTPPGKHPRPVYAVGVRSLPLVDGRRQVTLPDGRVLPRTLTTYVRYPAVGAPGGEARPGAAPARGRFPLVVFGHGFGYTPGTYRRLLDAWTRSGYVVAAPMFPLENKYAPGGPRRSDLPNQPGDVSYVIDQLLAASAARQGSLSGLIDRRRVAVAGHSDGGDTALALGYNSLYRDSRVRALIVLSGAEMPGVSGWEYARPGPPLLAVQGSADRVNPPADTRAYWAQISSVKYLLTLRGAPHLRPYTRPGRRLTLVTRATVDFLDRYLRADRAAGSRLRTLLRRSGSYLR